MDDEYRIKTQLLGRLKSRPVTNQFQPTRADLVAALEGPDSIIHAFCQGCGMTFEITDKARGVFQSEFSLAIPENPKGLYLHCTRCVYCDVQYHDFELMPIPLA